MKNASTARVVRLCTALAAFAAVAVWADGELDSTFAPPIGATQIPFLNSTHGYLHAVQTFADGTIEAAGFAEPTGLPTAATPAPDLFVAKLDPAGHFSPSPQPSFSQAAIKAAINGPSGVVINPRNGDLFVVGSNAGSNGLLNATVYWLNSAGKVLRAYTRLATGAGDQSACVGFHPLLDKDGRLVASCFYGDTNGTLKLAALKLIPQARPGYKGGVTTYTLVPDSAFGTNGLSVVTYPGHTVVVGTSIAQDASSGDYYVGGFACAGSCLGVPSNQTVAQVVARLNGISGALDTTYGNGNAGFAVALTPSATGGNPEAITLDSAGRVVIGGNYLTAGSVNGTGYVARLNSAGAPDSGFGTNGVVQGIIVGNEVIDLRTDATNQVYALDHGSHLLRLTNSGLVDATFSASGSDVQMLNGSGSVWQSMQFVAGTQATALLAGGVSAACATSCATTAVVAKVNLISPSRATTTKLTSTPPPHTFGDTLYFTATVTGAGTIPIPTGTVTFMDGTVTLGTGTLANGAVTYTPISLSVGIHNITATYGGDTSHAPSSSPPLTITVNATAPVLTTMMLDLLPATSSVGQAVTITATVTGSNPTGTVTFSEGMDILGTGLLTGGVATVTTDVLTFGPHTITATYNGDATYGGSSQQAFESVSKATPTTALTVLPATITEGQSVTLTAAAAGVAGLTPTGTVMFKDGTTALGMAVALQPDGTASISTTMLTVGNHSLTAEYAGDTNYSPGISPAVMEMVNAKPVPPSASSGGGGGGGLGLLDLCALLLVATRAVRKPETAYP